jgi:hypothetical protein
MTCGQQIFELGFTFFLLTTLNLSEDGVAQAYTYTRIRAFHGSFPRSWPKAKGHRPHNLLRVLLAIQYWIVEPRLPPGTINGLWIYSGIASLLLGSRLLNPYFTPPGDAATNAFVSCVSILAAWEAAHEKSMPLAALYWAGAYSVAVFIISIISLLLRPPLGMRSPPWLIASERFARALGAPNVIFTVVIVAAVWVFHRSQPLQVFAILTATLFIVAFAPIDRLLAFISWLNDLGTRTEPEGIIGLIAAHQSPGIVLIRQTDGATIPAGCPLLVCDDGGPQALGVALNYVGLESRRAELNQARRLCCFSSRRISWPLSRRNAA